MKHQSGSDWQAPGEKELGRNLIYNKSAKWLMSHSLNSELL